MAGQFVNRCPCCCCVAVLTLVLFPVVVFCEGKLSLSRRLHAVSVFTAISPVAMFTVILCIFNCIKRCKKRQSFEAI